MNIEKRMATVADCIGLKLGEQFHLLGDLYVFKEYGLRRFNDEKNQWELANECIGQLLLFPEELIQR